MAPHIGAEAKLRKPSLSGKTAVPDPQQDSNIDKEADSLFQTLLHEAINIPGDHGIPHDDIFINDSKEEVAKLQEGRAFFFTNYFACSWAIILTEFAQFPIQRITSFVLRNKNYNGSQFAYLRTVTTTMHVFKWFGESIEKKTAESAQDVYKVRRMHAGAIKRLGHVPPPLPNIPKQDRLPLLEAMRKDMAHIPTPDYLPKIMTPTPAVLISQFDMVMVQGVFYFLLDLNPTIMGLHTNKGYESYVYYIGIIGRYLGMEDRFNLALHPNPSVRKAVVKRFWDEIIIPCFKNFQAPEFLNLCYFAENGFMLNPYDLVMYYTIKDVLGIGPATHTLKFVPYKHRLMLQMWNIWVYFLRFRPVMYISNALMHFWYWVSLIYTREMRKNGI